ncbi:MAG: flagellar basal body P-ring formation chaperone FlgA [Pseudomonadota bacterium]
MTLSAMPSPAREVAAFLHNFLQAFLQVAVGFGWIIAVILITQMSQARGAEAIAEARLKTNIAVSKQTIFLSDVFDGLDEAADKPLAASPEPGERLSLRADYLARKAAEAGVRWPNQEGALRVIVRRASQTIANEDIVAGVREALLARSDADDLDVFLANPTLTLHAPIDELAELAIEAVQFDARTGRFQVAARAHANGPQTTISGRAVAVTETPTLARDVDRGEVIAAADIAYARTPANRVPPGAVREADDIIGQAAKRRLRAGAPVRASDIAAPVVVSKGSLVTMTYEKTGLRLTMTGRALANAGAGDAIDVANLQTHRTVQAIVESSGAVRVLAPFGVAGLR